MAAADTQNWKHQQGKSANEQKELPWNAEPEFQEHFFDGNCYGCGKYGHQQRDCPQWPEEKQQGQWPEEQPEEQQPEEEWSEEQWPEDQLPEEQWPEEEWTEDQWSDNYW